jgi:hypothetical protein
LEGFSRIKTLVLSNMPLKYISRDSLTPLHSIKEITMNNTLLTEAPRVFSHIQSKRSLPMLTFSKVVVKFNALGTSVSNVLFIVISLIECNGVNESRDIH